ncbi:MAG: LolA family protein [Bacteroidales bacterium]
MKSTIKAILLLTVFVMTSWQVQAQSRDKQATEILNVVTQKTKAYDDIRLEFEYRMENPDANINEVTEGTAVVSGDKYRLNIAGQTVISDGETVWTVIPDAEEVQVNDAAEGEEVFTPTNLLTNYNEDYKSKLIPRKTEINGIQVHTLELTPNEKKTFDKVNLYIRKSEMQLYAIEIFDQNGSKYTYSITSFEPNTGVDENTFKFSATEFQDFDVIDMR